MVGAHRTPLFALSYGELQIWQYDYIIIQMLMPIAICMVRACLCFAFITFRCFIGSHGQKPFITILSSHFWGSIFANQNPNWSHDLVRAQQAGRIPSCYDSRPTMWFLDNEGHGRHLSQIWRQQNCQKTNQLVPFHVIFSSNKYSLLFFHVFFFFFFCGGGDASKKLIVVPRSFFRRCPGQDLPHRP